MILLVRHEVIHGSLKRKESTLIYSIIFFSARVIKWWNKLDDDVVCATSANVVVDFCILQRIWEKDEFVFGP